MLFEKDKYYKYICTLEKIINFSYAIYMFLGFVIGAMIGNILGAIVGTSVGFLIATIYTINTKIRIQDMKWKMDIYFKLNEK